MARRDGVIRGIGHHVRRGRIEAGCARFAPTHGGSILQPCESSSREERGRWVPSSREHSMPISMTSSF